MPALAHETFGDTRRAAMVETSSTQRMRVPPKRTDFELQCCGRTIQRHCAKAAEKKGFSLFSRCGGKEEKHDEV